MKKMIRKPLKSRAKPRKSRINSVSTQNTDADGADILKESVSTDNFRNWFFIRLYSIFWTEKKQETTINWTQFQTKLNLHTNLYIKKIENYRK